MHLFVKGLRDNLILHSNAIQKQGAEAYLRNQFVFIGVDTKTRRKIFKEYVKHHTLPGYNLLPTLIGSMWQMEREMQYCAIELAAMYKQYWEPDFSQIIESFITTNSWWDTVDSVASYLSAPYFKKFPKLVKLVTGRWNQSKNFWLQRSSLLFQLKYKEQTDTDLLRRYILHLAGSDEFFIQKAIGWVLREYAKTNETWVKNFVLSNQLKPLSRREALKHVAV